MMKLTRIREALDRGLELLSPSSAHLIFTGDPAAGRRMALSFDDGPSLANTPHLLDLLRDEARATFFVVGDRIEGCEEILERMVHDGHEVGNHSFTHPHTVELNATKLSHELGRTNEALGRISIEPQLVRPPFGKDRRRVAQVGRALGLTTAMWSVDSGDTKGLDANEIAEHVLAEAKPGAIVLLHDGGDHRADTLRAVATLLPALRGRGFELVTISELLGLR